MRRTEEPAEKPTVYVLAVEVQERAEQADKPWSLKLTFAIR